MKKQLIALRVSLSLLCSFVLLLAAPVRAQITTNVYVTAANQGASDGTNWNSAVIWKLNNGGSATAAASGTATLTTTNYNFYTVSNNGTLWGNGTAAALIRPPYSANTPSVATFPGDSLILLTNGAIRFKHLNNGAASVDGTTFGTPTNIFPGNFGQPGLVLSGGILNPGDSPYVFAIQGTMYAAPGTQSYINCGDSMNNNNTARGLVIQSQLTGSGTIALVNSADATSGPANAALMPTVISGTNNNFTGSWVVKAGWLQGKGDGTSDGYTSLGTNAAVVYDMDPNWTKTNTFAAASYFYNGPAVLDMGPGLINSSGSLILTNGGQLFMHGTLIFSNVTVEGTKLAAGTYTYATLASTFSATGNFTPAGANFTAPSGTLTVQASGPPVIPALISVQPLPEVLYANRTAVFSVIGGGTAPLYYQWYSNSVALSDGGGVLGSATNILTINNVSASDDANYQCIITNAFGPAPSAAVTLSVVGTESPYETAVSNLNPVAYYQFDEIVNPASGGVRAYDYAGGFNGTYGTSALNGFDSVSGPTPGAGFSGFATTNEAVELTEGSAGNFVSTPDWNLNTNTVTMIAWLNPSGVQTANAGVVMCRGANTVAGLNFNGVFSPITSQYDLGYIWNNDPDTSGWDSGLAVPSGQWSMVSLVVTPTNATIYMMNATGLTSSSHAFPHIVQAFDANNTTLIGEDSADGGNGTRSFLGSIDEVAVFNSAMTGDQLAGLFYSATGTTNYAPVIGLQPPATTAAYVGETFQLSVNAYGSEPLTYQWASAPTASGGPYVPLTDAGILGSTTATVTFQSATLAEAMDYVCVVSNTATLTGVTSIVANVTVTAPNSAQIIIVAAQQAAGLDWNTGASWSDGNPASVSAISEPGSTYVITNGARLRTPLAATFPVFPGNVLQLDGSGVFINNPGAGTPQGELRTKQPTPTEGNAPITFPMLVMNGGQFDNGNGGVAEIQGVVNVVSNAIFYVDSSGAAARPIQIDSYIMGNANIEYHDFDASLTGGLIITCPTNSYTGTWNDVQGPLVGVGSNCLGTNAITIGAAGVLQTLYNITNTNSILILSGKMYLTQNDTFAGVIVGSTSLPSGTYTAAQLNASYPTFFPTAWIPVAGAPTQTNASGSITVLANSGATVIQNPTPATASVYPTQSANFSGLGGGTGTIYYQWQLNGAKLTDSTNGVTGAIINGSQTPNLSLVDIASTEGGNYTLVVSNFPPSSSITSAPAVLTILPTLPAIIPITLGDQMPSGDDWNTAGQWSDGVGSLPASTTALEYPGSTYEIQQNALMRTPQETTITYTNFPGILLTVDGASAWVDGASPASGQGEIRFKQGVSGVTNYFPHLVLAGGELDNGNPGTAEIAGELEVTTNSFIYVDTGGGTGRPFELDAYLTGSGSLLFHDFDNTLSGGLYLTCNTNTYTGAWDVDLGALVGGGAHSLGTNNILVGPNGVLETMYDMDSPHARLTLNGRVFLHQNDTFNQMSIGSTGLAAGVYTYAQLAAAYPAQFPATWTSVFGSTSNTASGSITLLSSLVLPPIITGEPPAQSEVFNGATVRYSVSINGNASTYQWYTNGVLVVGATNSSFTFTATDTTTNYCVVTNASGAVTTVVATNTITSTPTPVTFDDTANWTLQGNGVITPSLGADLLELTDGTGGEAASAFYNFAQYIEGFKATFTYTPSGNLAADGVTFCIQDATNGPAALGAAGGDLGFTGIANSAAFELNIYAAATGGVGIGTGLNGQIANPYGPVTNSSQTTPLNLASGDPINVTLIYSAGLLQATLTDSVTLASIQTNLNIGNVSATVGDSVGYVGFTGGDGGSTSIQQISNFNFVPAAPAVFSPTVQAGSVVLSWPAAILPDFQLQSSAFVNGPWANFTPTSPPILVGNQYQLTLTPGGAGQYYRFIIP